MKKWIKRIIIILFIIGCSVFLYKYFMDSSKHKASYLEKMRDTVIYLNGSAITNSGVIERLENHVFIDVSLIEKYMPSRYRVSTSKKRLLFSPQDLNQKGLDKKGKALINQSDFEINLPVLTLRNKLFIDINYLPYFANIHYVDQGGIVQLYTPDNTFYYAYLNKKEALRLDQHFFSPKLANLNAQQKVYVLEVLKRHLKVITSEGYIGYIDKSSVEELYKMPKVDFPSKVNRKDEKYSKWQMTFDHLSTYNHVLKAIPQEKIEGLDVLIPTVFRLTVDGWVLNNIDVNYINEAHRLGYRVYALFDNQFDADLTHETLKNDVLVNRIINQLEFYVRYYDLDGINIDFENVYLKDRSNFTAFIKALHTRFKDLDIVLSVDATRPGGSDNWSKFLDRGSIANFSDYIIFMAYDEHWATSPIAGSVASLPWVESGIKLMLEEVPKHKLILGVPTYMRVWKSTGKDGKIKSSALSMANLGTFLDKYDVYKNFDVKTGQNYYEMLDEKGQTLKIWAEDETSVRSRVQLANKYGLVGIASWRKGFESEKFWRIVLDALD